MGDRYLEISWFGVASLDHRKCPAVVECAIAVAIAAECACLTRVLCGARLRCRGGLRIYKNCGVIGDTTGCQVQASEHQENKHAHRNLLVSDDVMFLSMVWFR